MGASWMGVSWVSGFLGLGRRKARWAKGRRKRSSSLALGRQALSFGSGTLASRCLGLLRDGLLYSVLPLDMKDSWIAAFRVPNFFRRILGEGGISVSFIPLWVELRQKKKDQESQTLAGGLLALILIWVGALSLVAFIFMDIWIPFWLSGPGFASVPGKWEQTVLMARIMLGFLFFISLFAYFMALLNGEQKFALTGLAPVGFNLCLVVGLYFFKNSGSDLIWISALCVTVGGAVQALILVPSLFRAGLFFKPLWGAIFHPIMGRMCGRLAPTFLSAGVLQILSLVNTYFASLLDPGALTYMYQGDRLLELPLSLIAVSLSVSLLPTLSKYWVGQDLFLFKNSLVENFKLFYLLGLPSALGLWFLGTDIMRVLFVRGQFTLGEAQIVGSLLKIYAFTLLFSGSIKILNQAFYGMGRTAVPAFVSLVSLLVHVCMAPFWMEVMGLEGLVLSTSLSLLLNLKISFWLLSRQLGRWPWRNLLSHLRCCVLACLAMGVYLFGIQGAFPQNGVWIWDLLILLFWILLGALIYFGSLKLLKCPEPSFSFLSSGSRSEK